MATKKISPADYGRFDGTVGLKPWDGKPITRKKPTKPVAPSAETKKALAELTKKPSKKGKK